MTWGRKGVLHRIAWVDLSTKEVRTEEPADDLYRKYLGGYGLGAYYLFTRQRRGVDSLGAESTLGLVTGPLTGTRAITGNRFAVVRKSPKTGEWGDAIFFTGIAEKPVYVLVENGGVTVHYASSLWGLRCLEVEEKLVEIHGKGARSAVIGPAGEQVFALAAIINDGGQAAGRSGLGMIMGSKRLKGVVALGTGEVPVAEEENLKALRKRIFSEYYQGNLTYKRLHDYGTPGVLGPLVLIGDAPLRNWSGWEDHFPNYEKIGGEAALEFRTKPYGCWMCPIACGAHVRGSSGPYAGDGHRPENETLGAFGTMCFNDDIRSICRLNNICNDYGMDTISTGSTVAFDIECYEKGIITKEDTGGIELTWGNSEAIVRITEQMARRLVISGCPSRNMTVRYRWRRRCDTDGPSGIIGRGRSPLPRYPRCSGPSRASTCPPLPRPLGRP